MLRFVTPAVSRSVTSTAVAAGVGHSSTMSYHEISDCDKCDAHVYNVNSSNEVNNCINDDKNVDL